MEVDQLNTTLEPTLAADNLTFDTATPGEFVPKPLVELLPWIAVAFTANMRYSVQTIGTCVVVIPIRQSVEVIYLLDRLKSIANRGG